MITGCFPSWFFSTSAFLIQLDQIINDTDNSIITNTAISIISIDILGIFSPYDNKVVCINVIWLMNE